MLNLLLVLNSESSDPTIYKCCLRNFEVIMSYNVQKGIQISQAPELVTNVPLEASISLIISIQLFMV